MPLTTDRVIETAAAILRRHGLADLSMRRLATELGVQPGALYWHVENKQTLLVRVADRMLSDVDLPDAGPGRTSDTVAAAAAIETLAAGVRAAVLPVPDGAEVVALGYALDPASVQAFVRLRGLVGGLGIAGRERAAVTDLIVHHLLGCVGAEQNRRLAGLSTRGAGASYERGLRLILRGLATR
ncbi:TetR/AcrR family transcriptional regulator [Rudaeicoccus suwonensis]|uniref:TetR family transcriptional regulator n=1 Tax=Rudaeicoccus suwonensis TaxID=657409 RepID=A0A561E9A7_9MICO|nr:TetR family transcriptional regulator [Rudaeicoccus suwonensis]TWE12150.1 TetR family transcriptional regulator [Rudaeicoccus suwonensis]